MIITSPAFQNDEHIPNKYTCDGAGISPPLVFSGIPQDAVSLVLIVDDPDAPSGLFTHWMLYDMSPATQQIPKNAQAGIGKQGKNDFQRIGYGGPCPPGETHRYFFKLHALSSMLGLPEGATRSQLDDAMKGRVMEAAELIGLYRRAAEPSETFAKQPLNDYTDDRDTSEGQLISG